nr:FkbM family methyltransferase [uncultured Butyrivibrio sp.]
MGFMDNISAEGCGFDEYIENYAGNTVVLYGRGQATDNTYELLKKRGIVVKHALINQRFLKKGMKVCDLNVESIEEFFSLTEEKVDVVVMIPSYKPEWLAPYKEKIHEVVFYDVAPALVTDKGNTSIRPFSFFAKKEEMLNEIYDCLSDEFSKKVLISYINQLISGDFSSSDGLVRSVPYFESDFIEFGNNEVFFDIGAFNGEDTERFFDCAGMGSKSIIFEPDKDNISLLNARLEKNDYIDSICIIDKAIYDKSGELFFSSDEGSGSGVSESGDIVIPCTSIDDYVQSNEGIIPTYIKMDIEGAELNALKGGYETICKYSPKLAICVYHRPEDLFNIWAFIKSLRNVDYIYSFYMRRYSISFRETVLYAMPRKTM